MQITLIDTVGFIWTPHCINLTTEVYAAGVVFGGVFSTIGIVYMCSPHHGVEVTQTHTHVH